MAVRRNSWLAVSATECAVSAAIDADPVISAATPLATAIARLAARATKTVAVLSPPPPLSLPSAMEVPAFLVDGNAVMRQFGVLRFAGLSDGADVHRGGRELR